MMVIKGLCAGFYGEGRQHQHTGIVPHFGPRTQSHQPLTYSGAQVEERSSSGVGIGFAETAAHVGSRLDQ